jgi:hypothetical protein
VAAETAERSDELAELGYNQVLDRSIGKFDNLPAGERLVPVP